MLTGACNFFLQVIIFHLAIIAIDSCLKYWFHLRYTSLKLRAGISIRLFRLHWCTDVFNRYIQKLGTYRSKFQKKWFTFGTWISLAALPLAVYFIFQSIFALTMNLLFKKMNDKNLVSHVTPYLDASIVGVNIPVSDFFYYVISLFICIFIHELGHALAAVREGLHIAGCGVFIVFLIPIAFVHIEGLEVQPAGKQLRIVCAGVWHNIVLALIAGIIVFCFPWFSFPFYEYGTGVQIFAINKNSPMQGAGGLKVNDVITKINGCPISDQDTWIRCIYQIAKSPTSGYCLTAEFIHENDETIQIRQQNNVVECCHNDTLTGLCFEYLERSDDPLELPQYSCLRVRAVVDQSQNDCQSSNNCENLHCFRPSLADKMKLFIFTRKNSNKALFLGQPAEVLSHVTISEYIQTTYLSTAIPGCLYKFLNFIIMFSGALAAMNLIPCFHFDGQFIAKNLVNIYLSKNVRVRSTRLAISLTITTLGTGVLVIYVILVFVTAFTRERWFYGG